VNKIYPVIEDVKNQSTYNLEAEKMNKKQRQENVLLVDCIVEFRSMLIKILTDEVSIANNKGKIIEYFGTQILFLILLSYI
jgi:hypothetical protein